MFLIPPQVKNPPDNLEQTGNWSNSWFSNDLKILLIGLSSLVALLSLENRKR